MIYKLYSVFDAAVAAYLPPMYLRAHGEAIRSFEAAVAKEDHDFHRFAEHYSLFFLGEWDDSTASFSIGDLLAPQLLVKAHEVIARQARAA